jgi:hypothetical protein
MLNYFNNKRMKGQSTLEYAILIIIIIGALLSIQVYIKRGVQGRLKSATDDIGDQFSVGNTNVVRIRSTVGQTSDTFSAGVTRSDMLKVEASSDLMNSSVMNVNQEFWGN